MSHTGNDQAIQVCEHRFHGLAALRRCRWQSRFQITRSVLRKDRIALGVRQIVSDPLNELMPVAPKVICAHIAERLCFWLGLWIVHTASLT